MRYLLQLLFILAVATASAQSSLELFQREAEGALHRAIRISELNEMGANNGETYCNQDPVLIKIRAGLDARLGFARFPIALKGALILWNATHQFHLGRESHRIRRNGQKPENLAPQRSPTGGSGPGRNSAPRHEAFRQNSPRSVDSRPSFRGSLCTAYWSATLVLMDCRECFVCNRIGAPAGSRAQSTFFLIFLF